MHNMKGYYFITDAALSAAGTIGDVTCAVRSGVGVVQYRCKEASTRAMYEEALLLKDICSRQALFLVNDRVDIALAVDADGVHIGQDDLPFTVARKLLGSGKIIGLTVHNLAEAREAESLGADYIGVSPIFATTTKSDAGKAAGIELVAAIKKEVSLPIVAIGGITLANAPGVIAAGADSVCAISCVLTAADMAGEIAKFQKLFK
jgi:thiamine-phosphate pyrophosphorylase